MIFKLHVDGLGNHAYCLSMPKMLAIKNLVLPVQTLSLLSLTFSRASVAILLIRLFSVAKTLKWTITAVMAIMTAFTVINIALSFEQQVGQHAELVLAYCAASEFCAVSCVFWSLTSISCFRGIRSVLGDCTNLHGAKDTNAKEAKDCRWCFAKPRIYVSFFTQGLLQRSDTKPLL